MTVWILRFSRCATFTQNDSYFYFVFPKKSADRRKLIFPGSQLYQWNMVPSSLRFTGKYARS